MRRLSLTVWRLAPKRFTIASLQRALALAILTSARIRVSTAIMDSVDRNDTGPGFQAVRDQYGDGAAEIAEQTPRDWEHSLEVWKRSRSSRR